MIGHLKWSLGGAGAVGLLIALALGGMLAAGIGDPEGLIGGTPMELLLMWAVFAILATSMSAIFLTLPIFALRFAIARMASKRFRAMVELALAVPLGLIAAHFLAFTYPDGARDNFGWYLLLLSIPGAIFAANVLQWMDGEAECAS